MTTEGVARAGAVPPMTSRERVLAALRREPVDRTPVVNPTSVATVELMDLVDAPFPDANREPELMARLAATGYTELGFDSIMPVFSIIQESSALGCKIQWEQKDNWPTVQDEGADLRVARRHRASPTTCSTIRTRSACSRRSGSCAAEFGDEVAIIGKTMGPVVARLPHASASSRSCCSRSTTRRQTKAGARPAQGDHDRLRGRADRGRRRRRDAARPRDRRPRLGRVLPALPARHAPRVRGADPRPDHPAHLRQDRRPDGLHRRDRHGGVPLRLEEHARRSRWRPSTAGSASSATSTTPRRSTRRGPTRSARRSWQNLEAGVQMVGPECAIPLQTPIENLLAIRDAVQEWHARTRGAADPRPLRARCPT